MTHRVIVGYVGYRDEKGEAYVLSYGDEFNAEDVPEKDLKFWIGAKMVEEFSGETDAEADLSEWDQQVEVEAAPAPAPTRAEPSSESKSN